MDITIPAPLAYVASWGTSMGVVWFLFEKTETALNTEAKRRLSQWLQNLDPSATVAGWRAPLAAMFDRIFGERHLSWNCFLRSSLASLAAIIISSLHWRAVHPREFLLFLAGAGGEYSDVGYPFWLFGMATILNFAPDYIALLKTRYVIWRLSTQTASVWAWPFLDLLATVFIWAIATVSLMLITFWVRIPRMPATQSIGRLPLSPRERCHLIHRIAATQSP